MDVLALLARGPQSVHTLDLEDALDLENMWYIGLVRFTSPTADAYELTARGRQTLRENGAGWLLDLAAAQ